MFPIGDDNSDIKITPVFNYLFIAVNLLVFIFLQGMGHNLEFTYAFATVPAEIITLQDYVTQSQLLRDPATGQVFEMPGLMPTPIPVVLTLFTSMFMHGGWAHLLGNMLYLWVFGDNIENRLGHQRYIIFYLLCGLIAGLSHVAACLFTPQNSLIPCLGASGAISGILGGYLMLYPQRSVKLLIAIWIVRVPSFIVLGGWILLQIVSGLGLLGGNEQGGVAYAAHIGGFIAGLMLIRFFTKK